MPAHRRKFLQALGAAAGACAITPAAEGSESVARIGAAARALRDRPPEDVATDEAFWSAVRAAFAPPERPINLMTGWYGALPMDVRRSVVDFWDKTNEPDYHVWANAPFWHRAVETARTRLAAHVNAGPDEVALTRNTTEALNTVIFGLDLKPGDELLTSERDYGTFKGAMKQRVARDGIMVKTVKLPVPAKEPGDLVAAFAAAITPRTRALLCCHVYSFGQITPIRALCDMAHARGVRVIIDAALAFGHVVTDLKAMDCDYYGASFHKFAGGPRGTGFLFVKKEHIPSLWPSYGSMSWTTHESNHASPEIGKLVAHGTDTTFLFAAVPAMLDLHEAIGPARRQARLFHLTRYWTDRMKGLEGVRFTAPIAPESVCGLVGLIPGKVRPRDLTHYLLKRRDLLVPYPSPEFNWVNTAVFTSPEELDRLVAVLETILHNGVPS
jgi:selenocysteine lyase/cysteine desulfurase